MDKTTNKYYETLAIAVINEIRHDALVKASQEKVLTLDDINRIELDAMIDAYITTFVNNKNHLK